MMAKFKKMVAEGDALHRDDKLDYALAVFRDAVNVFETKLTAEYKTKLAEVKPILYGRAALVEDVVVGKQAAQLLEKGTEAYGSQDFENALCFFEQAYSMVKNTKRQTNAVLAPIFADAERRMGQTKRTVEAYFENQVKSYKDRVVLLNIDNETEAAQILGGFYEYLSKSRYGSRAKSSYEDLAKVVSTSRKEADFREEWNCLESAPALAAVRVSGGKTKTFTVNRVSFNVCEIPAGTFTMGSPSSETGKSEDEVQHRVTISKPFYMMETEVTQELYEAVMGNNPSSFKAVGKTAPVESVSWNGAVAFCEKLSTLTGVKFRLPTEAEWEYACRAGTQTAYHWGDSMNGDYAWYSENSGSSTHPVKQKKPNAFGLYDMSGNVWELCADWYGEYPSGSVTDPTGLSAGAYRVFRGGGWNNDAGHCRSAFRGCYDPSLRIYYLGFRACAPVR